MTDAQPMPCNLDLEYAMLGAIMCNNQIMTRLAFLTPAHFYSAPHAAIYAAMLRLSEAGEPVTPFKVQLSPEAAATFTEAGGVVRYLAGAVSAAVNIRHAAEEAKTLVALARKRLFIQSCQQAAANAADSGNDVSEHAAALGGEIEDLLRSGAAEFEDDYAVTVRILDDLKSVKRPTPTGLHKLDTAMGGGLFPGKSYGFAARKKVGKTILAGTISCNLARQGVRHLFVCGEMSPQEIHQRTLARLSDSYPSAFQNDYGKSQEFEKKIAQLARESTRCTLYHNAPGLTFHQLRRVVATAVYTKGVKGFILDYWQLVGGKRNGQSTAEHLDEVAQWVADTCRKFGIWSITMAQLNQEGNTRGGEGMRLAFDQVYAIRGMLRTQDNQEAEDLSEPHRWLEMLDTRYTKWCSVGDGRQPGLDLMEKGPYFECSP